MSRCFSFVQVFVVVEAIRANDMVRFLEARKQAYTQLSGRGDGAWQAFFSRPPVSREKSIFIVVIPEEQREPLFEALREFFKLDKPAQGIAWAVPITEVLTAGMEGNDAGCARLHEQ